MQENIKVLRVAFNKTQEEMAGIIGCSTNAYIQKEKERVPFTVEEIKLVKAYFNLSIEKTWNIFFEKQLNKNEMKRANR